MERWHEKLNKRVASDRADAFMADIIAVCQKHNMCIWHEDGNGAFIIEDGPEGINHLNAAMLGKTFKVK